MSAPTATATPIVVVIVVTKQAIEVSEEVSEQVECGRGRHSSPASPPGQGEQEEEGGRGDTGQHGGAGQHYCAPATTAIPL